MNFLRDESSMLTMTKEMPKGTSDLSSDPGYAEAIASFKESNIFAGESGKKDRGRLVVCTERSTHLARSPSQSSHTHSGLKPMSFRWVDPIVTNAETEAICKVSHKGKMNNAT